MKNIFSSKVSVFNQIVFSMLFVPALLAGFLLAKPVFASSSWATSSAVMNVPRVSFASAVAEAKIYVLGGDTGGVVPTNSIESYDPKDKDEWKNEISTIQPRWGLAAVSIDGQLITVSAGSPIPEGSITTESYDPETGFTQEKRNMPQPGWGASAVAIGQKMHVLGGYNWPEWGQAYNREYDSLTNDWALKEPMKIRRSWFSAEVINGLIYAVGGWDWNDSQDVKELEIYDPIADEWRFGPSLPVGIKGLATAVLGTRLYAIGGDPGQASDKVYVLDTANEALGWQEQLERLPVTLTGAEAEVIDGTIYVFGGILSDGSVNGHTYYLGEGPRSAKRNPVIIVPGIIASYLNNAATGEEIWPNFSTMAIPGGDSYLNALTLDDNGFLDVDNTNVRPAEILRNIDWSILGFSVQRDFFAGLIQELRDNGYKEGTDLFVFPYDWRVDINILAGDDSSWPAIYTLKEKINDVKLATQAEKVDIIAHSMGGIVTKTYIKKYGQNNIDKFVDIATPHLGSPDAFKILSYGDNLEIPFLDHNRIKAISQNFPSVYQLLPSRAYFDIKDFNIPDQDYKSYVIDVADLDENGINGDLNYDQTAEFLTNQGRNNILLNILKVNESLHGQIDDLQVSNSYNIVGAGVPTIGKIYVLNKEKNGKFEYGLDYINGDGTVPFRSAESFSDNLIYASGTHAYLPSADGVRQVVASILKGDIQNFDYSQYKYLSLDREKFNVNSVVISLHSPIELHVYDEFGNHVGPTAKGDIEIGISGARYDVIEDNKFAVLPKGGKYTVTGQATEAGIFNARIEIIENGQYIKDVYFNELPLESTFTKIKLSIEDGQTEYAINIDGNGDNNFEQEVAPSSILAGNELSDLTKPTTEVSVAGAIGDNGYYVSDVAITLSASDNNSGVLKTEYSTDNGLTWIKYVEPITVFSEKENKILYSSTDRAGNREEDKEIVFKIDKTVPEILILTPAEINRNVLLNIENLITDADSGVAAETVKIYFDGQEISGQAVDLFSKKLGEHEIKIMASDKAGNQASVATKVDVVTDIFGFVADVNRGYQENLLNKKAKDELIKDLDGIQKFIEKSSQREEKRDQKEQKLMVECAAKKGMVWCDSKLGQIFTKTDYRLSEVNKKLLKTQYALVLKKLELYRKLDWVEQAVYAIIKEDLEYLINKI